MSIRIKPKHTKLPTTLCLLLLLLQSGLAQQKEPLKLGVIGLTHGHVGWILSRKSADVQMVGIVETNRELAQRHSTQHGFSMDIV